jgi:hypothetical protein
MSTYCKIQTLSCAFERQELRVLPEAARCRHLVAMRSAAPGGLQVPRQRSRNPRSPSLFMSLLLHNRVETLTLALTHTPCPAVPRLPDHRRVDPELYLAVLILLVDARFWGRPKSTESGRLLQLWPSKLGLSVSIIVLLVSSRSTGASQRPPSPSLESSRHVLVRAAAIAVATIRKGRRHQTSYRSCARRTRPSARLRVASSVVLVLDMATVTLCRRQHDAIITFLFLYFLCN